MITFLAILVYYIIGNSISAWMLKTNRIKRGDTNDNFDELMVMYVAIPLFWPILIAFVIFIGLFKIHILIHSILFHSINVLNIRVTKEDGNTVIRFHVPKKAAQSATNS